MVSTLSIVFMVLNMLLGILIPVGLLLIFRKKYRATLKSFFIGCAVMLFFALILEQMVHVVVLGSKAGTIIQNNMWLYALYGSLMAGIFEETGRFLAMRFLLKKEHGNPHNALMYGAGHGGFEAMVLLTIGMINNLIYSILINLGQTQVLLAPLDEAARGTLQAAFDTLIATPSWHFLLSPMERIGAIAAQISLSVIVWFAAAGKKCRIPLFLLAIILHGVLDVVAVIASKIGIPVLVIELLIWGMAVIYMLLAKHVWKKYFRS